MQQEEQLQATFFPKYKANSAGRVCRLRVGLVTECHAYFLFQDEKNEAPRRKTIFLIINLK